LYSKPMIFPWDPGF